MPGNFGGALRKKKRHQGHSKDVENSKFYTPARFGWGRVAGELHPHLAKVRVTHLYSELSFKHKFQIKLGPLGGRQPVPLDYLVSCFSSMFLCLYKCPSKG